MSAKNTIQLRLSPAGLVAVAVVGVVLLFLLTLKIGTGIKNYHPVRLDEAWSSSVTFSSSQEALNSAFGIVTLNGEPVCVNGNDYFFLEAGGTSWTKKTFPPPDGTGNSIILADPASRRLIFSHGEVKGGRLNIYKNTHSDVVEGKLEAAFTICSLHPELGITPLFHRDLSLGAKDLFGEVLRSGDEQPVEPIWRQQYGPPLITPSMGGLGSGVILGEDVYIPYIVECSAFYGSQKEAGGSGPWQTGLLHSSGDCSHWTTLKLFDVYTLRQGVFATRDNLYCLAERSGENERKVWGLWCVRMPRTADAKPESELIAPTFRYDIYGAYSAVTEDDTIHLIWLDGRHVKGGQLWALETGTPDQVNLELYYRSRKDSASEWTKEILLSKGLRFVFAPDMAIEGNNIVVVWSGYQKGYGEFCPSDIYFTTSCNAGKTWTPIARITDSAKSGLVSGRPRVALHNGEIHLFYIQGKLENHEIGAGLRLLNQAPWPIIYQHRAFPEKNGSSNI